MLKTRNLLALGITLVLLMAFMIPLAAAQPAQQATATPEPTLAATETPAATEAVTPTETSVAPAVSPLATPIATPVSTPGTLPTTGGSDDGMAALGTMVIVLGALLLLGAFGLALSRRGRTIH